MNRDIFDSGSAARRWSATQLAPPRHAQRLADACNWWRPSPGLAGANSFGRKLRTPTPPSTRLPTTACGFESDAARRYSDMLNPSAQHRVLSSDIKSETAGPQGVGVGTGVGRRREWGQFWKTAVIGQAPTGDTAADAGRFFCRGAVPGKLFHIDQHVASLRSTIFTVK